MFNPFEELAVPEKKAGRIDHIPEIPVPGLEDVIPEAVPNSIHPEIINGALDQIYEEEEAEKRREAEIEKIKRIIQ